MQIEERKLSHELGWIVGLGLLGIVAAYLIDPGPCEEQVGANPLDPAEYGLLTTGSAPEKPTSLDKPR